MLSAFYQNLDIEIVSENGVCSFGGRTEVLSIRLILSEVNN